MTLILNITPYDAFPPSRAQHEDTAAQSSPHAGGHFSVSNTQHAKQICTMYSIRYHTLITNCCFYDIFPQQWAGCRQVDC